jgi:lysophospholipid acyltransferase (LPLAT)-like uncharacterized protein
MKLRGEFINKVAGLAVSTLVRGWMGTLDYRVAYYDPAVDPVHESCTRRKIYVFWHEYILIPLHMRGHCQLAMLLSQHGDADLLSRGALHLGFDTVRGSTSRGGAAAIRQLMDKGRLLHLTITPDGPRGPRRKLAQGPIYLASRLGLPLVLMGFGADRPWRLGTWDRFAIPRPYSKVRSVISPEIHLPPDLDREGIEHYRVEAERLLNWLTRGAEEWARGSVHWANDQPAYRMIAPQSVREALRNPHGGNFESPIPTDHQRPSVRAA